MKIIFAILLSFSSMKSIAMMPNEVDLKSSYCMAYLNNSIELFKKINNAIQFNGTDEMKKSFNESMTLTNLTHARDRIRRYLEPRLTMLDTTALTQAFMQSQEDENLFKIYSEKKCDINNDPVKCAENFKRDYPSIDNKRQDCQKFNWLPF